MPTSQSEIRVQNARQGESGRGVRLGLALGVCAMVLMPIVAH